MGRKKPRDKVFLVAENAKGAVVERLEVSHEDYYEGDLEIVDSDAYRAKRGIRRLKGEIYGYKGNLLQTFDVEYSVKGKYLHSRAVHEDGTVI